MGFIQKNKVYIIAAVIVIVGIVIYFTVFRNTSQPDIPDIPPRRASPPDRTRAAPRPPIPISETPTLITLDAPEPTEPVAAAYAYGGVDGCPAGYRALSEGECDPSSIQIEGATWNRERKNETDTGYPKGCYTIKAGKDYPIYWNAATTSTANERGWDGFWDVVRRACKRA